MEIRSKVVGVLFITVALAVTALAQQPESPEKQQVRSVTIPISIFTKKELKQEQLEEYVHVDRLVVKEDKEEQVVLSVRSVDTSPLSLAVLIQENLTSSINLQLKDISDFIKGLPRGSRVMVAYIRGGSLHVKQRFTDNLDRAASALQIVGGQTASNGPFDGVADASNLFEGLPSGRRAILLVSDGLEASRGGGLSDSIDSPELDRAVLRAQKRSIAVYSIYSPTPFTQTGNTVLTNSGQSALEKISDETGGRSFYQGSGAPVSFSPFLKSLDLLLGRQFALTYLSTHMKKGYHHVEVFSTNPDVKIEHPKGYYYR